MQLRTLSASLALMFGLAAAPAHAATKTVDAAGGGDYTTLAAAIDDMNNDLWGAEPHTILVTDNQVNFVNQRSSIIRSVTIQAAPGDTPIFVVDQTNLGNAHIFYAANAHDITFDGLTFMGNAGSQPSDSDNGLFRVDNEEPPGRLRFTLRNCLITANNGSNQPVTDYTLDPTTQRGYFYHAVLPYRSTSNAPIDTLIENCTFAYCTRGVAVYGATFPGGSITMRNTLSTQITGNHLLLLQRDYANIPVDIDECAFLVTDEALSDTDGNMFHLLGDNLDVSITDSVFRSKWNTAVRCEGFSGSSLDMRRVTTYIGRQLFFATALTGNQNFTVHDGIWYYVSPRITAGAFGILGGNPTVNFDNMAVFEERWDSSDGGTAMPALQAAVAALSPPLIGTDPLFVRTDLGSEELGLIGWNRLNNTLFDVTNVDFLGVGTVGERPQNALAGGADHTAIAPTAASNWSILD